MMEDNVRLLLDAVDLLDEDPYPRAFDYRYDMEVVDDEATLVEFMVNKCHGKSLWLDLCGVRDCGWERAQSLVAEQDNLEFVLLRGPALKKVERNTTAGFLRAVQQNQNVQAMDLRSISGATLPAFIEASRSLQTLALWDVTFPPEQKLALPVALRCNMSIRRLVLRGLNQQLTIQILYNLASNTTISELVFDSRRMTRAVVLACCKLLAVTTTIQQLELRSVHIHRLRPIADALIASSSILRVIFRDCRIGQPDQPTPFLDEVPKYLEEDKTAFEDILLSKDNITRLSVCNSDYEKAIGRPLSFFQGIIHVLHPSSKLRTLELQFSTFAEGLSGSWGSKTCWWGRPPSEEEEDHRKGVMVIVKTFWAAVETSPLDRLSVAKICCKDEFEVLLQAVPRLSLSSLAVGVDMTLECGRVRMLRTQFLTAIVNNGCLRKVEVQQSRKKNWFDEDEQRLLDLHLQQVPRPRDYTPAVLSRSVPKVPKAVPSQLNSPPEASTNKVDGICSAKRLWPPNDNDEISTKKNSKTN